MDDLPADLDHELKRLLGALSDDLRLPAFNFAVVRGALTASVTGQTLLVPSSFVDHWRRFHVIPSALVRDAAYAAKKVQLRRDGATRSAQVEADAMAYSERFLKAAMSAAGED